MAGLRQEQAQRGVSGRGWRRRADGGDGKNGTPRDSALDSRRRGTCTNRSRLQRQMGRTSGHGHVMMGAGRTGQHDGSSRRGSRSQTHRLGDVRTDLRQTQKGLSLLARGDSRQKERLRGKTFFWGRGR